MRDKKTIESLAINPEDLPVNGNRFFDRYKFKLEEVLKENLRGFEGLTFCPGYRPADKPVEAACFSVEIQLGHYVADSYPNLRIGKCFHIDPLKPLMPQIEDIKVAITCLEEDLLAAARAITDRHKKLAALVAREEGR